MKVKESVLIIELTLKEAIALKEMCGASSETSREGLGLTVEQSDIIAAMYHLLKDEV